MVRLHALINIPNGVKGWNMDMDMDVDDCHEDNAILGYALIHLDRADYMLG